MWGVKFDKDLKMYSLPICRRHPLATIEIGSGVSISNLITENLAGVTHRTVLYANSPGARLIIGNHVGISGVVLFCTTEIVIEDYVNLGVGVKIYDTDFHSVVASERRINNPNSIKRGHVRICRDVFVGANAIILKGVTIGPRSVIGAGAIVTKDVPPDSIAAGTPAIIVKKIDQESADGKTTSTF